MLLKVLFLFSPLENQTKAKSQEGFSPPGKHMPGARGSFHQAGTVLGCWDCAGMLGLELGFPGLSRTRGKAPPGLEVGFVLGLAFLKGPPELAQAALAEAGCSERARHAVIS